jgi:hypothetical protein
MNAKPVLARPHIGTTIVATVLSVLIWIGLRRRRRAVLRDGAP